MEDFLLEEKSIWDETKIKNIIFSIREEKK